jgi:uncharacterized protein
MAHIGILTFEIFIPHAQSLKEKRRVIKSLKDQIHSRYNVSIAETEYQDKWQRAQLTACMVGPYKNYVDAGLAKILDVLRTKDDFELIGHELELL